MGAVRHRHEALDGAQMRAQLADQAGKGNIEEENLVFRVIDNVLDLLGEKTRIDCVQHRADSGDGEIEFHVAMRVPGQRADAVAGLHAHGNERLGKLLGATADFAIIGANGRAFAGPRDDLGVRMIGRGMLDQ